MANLTSSGTRRNGHSETDTLENGWPWTADTLTTQSRTDSGTTGVEVKHA